MKPLPITLRCDCGEGGAKVPFGERWTCDRCGRTYDTKRIPADEMRALERLALRYRAIGWVLAAVIAGLMLALILGGQPLQVMVAVPFLLISWFSFGRPIVRNRYRRALASRPRWELRAEGWER